VDCWIDWAIKAKIRPEVTSFIKFSPTLLLKFDADKSYQEGQAYPNPRSWEYIHDLLELGVPKDLEKVTFSGTIGEEAASMFHAHLPIFRTNMNLMDIVLNKSSFEFPPAKELANRWAFCFGVPSMANEKTIVRILEIANILYSKFKESEFSKVIISSAVANYPEVCNTSIWYDFSKSPLGKSMDNNRVMV
jgi:hypothetical protein